MEGVKRLLLRTATAREVLPPIHSELRNGSLLLLRFYYAICIEAMKIALELVRFRFWDFMGIVGIVATG